jgi:hypothetical protein
MSSTQQRYIKVATTFEISELIKSVNAAGKFTLDLSDRVVNGDLLIPNLHLTSLAGCPRVVRGTFDCSNNRLTSLEGGPTSVLGYYFCMNNPLLRSLRGSPATINASFYCNESALTTLEGGPKVVKDEFACSKNPLTSLRGAPERVGGFFADNCQYLRSLADVHLYLKEIRHGLSLRDTPLEANVLGLLLIDRLDHVELADKQLMAILNKHLAKPKAERNLLACALELVEAGLEEFARL